MAPETPPPPAARRPPPPWMLAMLGIAVVALVAYWLWPATVGTSSSPGSPSNQQGTARGQAAPAAGAPSLDVRLGDLKAPPPEPTEGERNPFRFQPKAPPPPPPSAARPAGRAENAAPVVPSGPPPPPPIPPIPLKFIGTLEGRGPGKLAIFSDSRGTPVYGHEGDIILGQYRVVRIGVESVVMEYADGRGRQTIPLRGQ